MPEGWVLDDRELFATSDMPFRPLVAPVSLRGEVVKHLQGEHDQSTHGRRRGASTPDDKFAPGRTVFSGNDLTLSPFKVTRRWRDQAGRERLTVESPAGNRYDWYLDEVVPAHIDPDSEVWAARQFHGTTANYLNQILSEGIQPGSQTGERQWPDRFYQDELRQQAVFLANNKDLARTYAWNTFQKLMSEGRQPEAMVIIELEIPDGVDLEMDTEGGRAWTAAYRGTIPPSWIKRYTILTPVEPENYYPSDDWTKGVVEVRKARRYFVPLVVVAEPAAKHLPGEHDQASHGSWATGTGKVEPQVSVTERGEQRATLHVKLAGLGGRLHQTEFDVTLYLVSGEETPHPWAIGYDLLLPLVNALTAYEGQIGGLNPDQDLREHQMARSAVRVAQAAVQGARKKISDTFYPSPEAAAEAAQALLAGVLNEPGVADTFNTALVWWEDTQREDEGLAVRESAYADPGLAAAIQGVGPDDIDGAYDLKKLDARFGSYSAERAAALRLELWERLGDVRQALGQWVDAARWQDLKQLTLEGYQKESLLLALTDLRQLTQWTLHHTVGFPITAYRGLDDDNYWAFKQNRLLPALSSFSLRPEVAEHHVGQWGSQVTAELEPGDILAAFTSDQGMWLAGESELLTRVSIPESDLEYDEPDGDWEPVNDEEATALLAVKGLRAAVAKHLAGYHDQLDHDPTKRPGPAATYQALERFEREHFQDPNEHVVVLDLQGQVRLTKDSPPGDDTQIEFSDSDSFLIPPGSLATHNHPTYIWMEGGKVTAVTDSAISPSDVAFAAHEELAEVRAVSRHYRFSIRPQPGRHWPHPALLEREYTAVLDRLKARDRWMVDGTPAERKAYANNLVHETWLEVAPRLGLVYERVEHGYT